MSGDKGILVCDSGDILAMVRGGKYSGQQG